VLELSPKYPLKQRLCALFLLASLCLGCSAVEPGVPTSNTPAEKRASLTLANGSTQTITVEQMDFTGQATLTLADGSSRSGTWKNGQLNGMGMEETPAAVYTGQWYNNLRHGHGELKHSNGDSYVGNFAAGQPDGRGIFTSNKGVYRGTWENGQKHGQGQFNGNNGEVYQGQWVNGKRQGSGVAEFSDGTTYAGAWLADQPHGFGRKTFASGASFEGSWAAGKRQGYGVFLSAAQVRYEGTWQDNFRHGFGKETRPDGSSYEGAWASDLQHGEGTAVFANDSTHQGQWRNGELAGEGRRTSRAGIVLSGFWQNNMLTTGQLLLPNGEAYNGPLFAPNGREVAAPLVTWLTLQATQKQAHAQFFLGSVMLDFDSPAADLQSAEFWLHKAATADVAEAQYRLAQLLMEQDRTQAVQWLEAAAAQDHPGAHATLGEMLHSGVHFPQNHSLALEHYNTAYQLGSLSATNNLAWLLATTADTNTADPQRAVELITPLVLYLGHWQHLDTLAAAHAREGNITLAVRLQQQALSQALSQPQDATSAEQISSMQERLDLYQTGQPFIN
jgi:TPR repeat protein